MIYEFKKYQKTYHLNLNQIEVVEKSDDGKKLTFTTVSGTNHVFADEAEVAALWEAWVTKIVPALGGMVE